MSRAGRPRVHEHLSRAAIAEAGLSIIDEDGVEALTMRSLAGRLGVGTMTLYRYVPDRDSLIKDIVESLLTEVDTNADSQETWDQSLRRTAYSLRAMTLRHPRAFELVAAAPVSEPPVLDYARRVALMHVDQSVPDEDFVKIWSVADAYLTGFMIMLAHAVMRARPAATGEGPEDADDLSAGLAGAVSEEAFGAGLNVVIEGLQATVMGDSKRSPNDC
jgi:AcrR family transcriptional regulator